MTKKTDHQKIRVAIFGAGGIARKAYLPILSTWPGLEIIGLFSRTQETIDKVCSEFQLSYGTTNAQELIGTGFDAAFVLTNDQTHFKFTEMLLNSRVDVLVEKPLAQNSAEAQTLSQIAEKNNRILMVGFNRRYSTLYKKSPGNHQW